MSNQDGWGASSWFAPRRRSPEEDRPTTRLAPIRPDAEPPYEQYEQYEQYASHEEHAPYAEHEEHAPYPSYEQQAPHGYHRQHRPYEPAPPPQPRRRGRPSVLLLAAAVLLGALGGVCYGYVEQSAEPAAALPPLNQPALRYPAQPAADAPEPLPAEHDRRVRTDGDLRKLLLDRPAGAVDAQLGVGGEGWLAPYEVAADSGGSGDYLSGLLELGLRRTAMAAWAEQDGPGSGRVTVVQLYQFRNETKAGSVQFRRLQGLAVGQEFGESRSVPLKGSSNGEVHFPVEPYSQAGQPPMYQGVALARRGDIVMLLVVMETAPVAEKDVTRLAQRQLERL